MRMILLACLLAWAPALPAAADDLARGDAAYAERALELEGRLAAPERIAEAIAAYDAALAADPSLQAQWRLLRALYYKGDFAAVDEDTARRAFDRGRDASERAVRRVTELLGDEVHRLAPDAARPALAAAGLPIEDVARVYFWASIHWAAWSRDAGLLRAAKDGAANRIRDYAEVAAALEPTYYRGGAYRMLSRLHAVLPRVPFLSGWVDRDRAVPDAERALEIAPADSGNRFLLALTLLELAPDRRAEARTLLRQVAETPPRPELMAEDLAVREAAQTRLAELSTP